MELPASYRVGKWLYCLSAAGDVDDGHKVTCVSERCDCEKQRQNSHAAAYASRIVFSHGVTAGVCCLNSVPSREALVTFSTSPCQPLLAAPTASKAKDLKSSALSIVTALLPY